MTPKKRVKETQGSASLAQVVENICQGRKLAGPPTYYRILATGFECAKKHLIFVGKKELEDALMKHFEPKGVRAALRREIATGVIVPIVIKEEKCYLMISYNSFIETITKSTEEKK